MKRYLLLFISLFSAGVASATFHPVTSPRNLDYWLGRRELAVVLFYYSDAGADETMGNDIERMEDEFQSASRRVYRDVAFIRVNLSKEELEGLADDYKVARTPAILLFKNGAPVTKRVETTGFFGMKSTSQQRAILEGFVTSSEILQFVRTHFGDEISEIKEEKREEAAERRRTRRRTVVWPGWWGGYPYYGYGWRGGYGYPYNHRYYYRPGFHWGVYW